MCVNAKCRIFFFATNCICVPIFSCSWCVYVWDKVLCKTNQCLLNQIWKASCNMQDFLFCNQVYLFVFPFYVFMSRTKSCANQIWVVSCISCLSVCLAVFVLYLYMYLYLYKVLCKTNQCWTKFGEWAVFPNGVNLSLSVLLAALKCHFAPTSPLSSMFAIQVCLYSSATSPLFYVLLICL